MFKRKWPFRRRSGTRFGKIPARRIPKSIARVRTDWVTIYNVTDTFDSAGCQYLVAPWVPANIDGRGVQCFSTFVLGVISAQALSDLYGDDVKIVAMRGDFWLKPVWPTADACDAEAMQQWEQNHANYFVRARGGLFKQRVVSSNANVDGAVVHPLYGQDWSDAGLLQTFEKNWPAPPARVYSTTWNDGQTMGVCANVHQAGVTVPPTSDGDQPTYNIPALSTTCGTYGPSEGECFDGPTNVEYVAPGWKRASISRRRDVHLHEDDSIAWFIDWTNLWPSDDACGFAVSGPAPCAMHIIPSLKVKLQYG